MQANLFSVDDLTIRSGRAAKESTIVFVMNPTKEELEKKYNILRLHETMICVYTKDANYSEVSEALAAHCEVLILPELHEDANLLASIAKKRLVNYNEGIARVYDNKHLEIQF